MRRWSPGRACGTATVAFLAAAGTPAAAQEIVPGQVTERIVSPTDTTQRYALYLPSSYGRAPAPVLFVLDPRGRAVDALEPFRRAAERHGWIVMSSWNSLSDGPVEPNVRAMNALLGDARASFEIARDRLYIAGFSGTARLAWDFARQLDGAVAGILGASAGPDAALAVLDEPPARPAFFGTAGVLDFNHDEMRRFERRLDAWELPWRMRIFDGGHQWPPERLAAEAIDWFELTAMRTGLAPLDADHVARMHAADSAAAADPGAADRPVDRLARMEGLARDYAGLRDTADAARAARALRADPRVTDALAREAALLVEAREREARLVEIIANVSDSDRPPSVDSLLDAFEVDALRQRAVAGDDEPARSARRTLEQIFVATSFYAPRGLIEGGRAAHALAVLEVADSIHAGRPQVLMQRARALAALGRLDEARDALGHAMDAGLPADIVRGDSLLAQLRQRTPSPDAERAELRSVRLDDAGVIRWTDTGEEVALFGANYALPSSSDFRAAGRITEDRKRLVDEDVAHFARMGWDGLRVAFWGDWQNADVEGNLIENEHLDLLDYLIARARERGIHILFNPIHTYHAGWPDAMSDSFPGFAAHIRKDRLGTDSAAIAAQVNYIRQILEHVNPYTGIALKDEPAILFIEMINEPVHHPEDLEGSVRYIDALVDAVRSTGSTAITFHNVSQDFRIAAAIRRSEVQGASFGWYPTGLNSGAELRGNHLRAVEDYPTLRMPELEGMPRVVYEFDSADQLTGTLYPAMAREYRAGGVQFAAMFAYDMLRTASRNLGWQTHYLNLVYTPRKAMSAIIAAEAMRRLPAGERYGPYPQNNTFGDFRVDPERDLGELAATDAFLYTGDTDTRPPEPARLERIAGHGSSPIVEYDGEGVYFLDRVRAGVWRLEVYPDAVPVADPFVVPGRRDRIVTRAIHREWPMRIGLPDLGPSFQVQAIVAGNPEPVRAEGGRITVRPGVFVLSRAGPVDPASLPSHIGAVRFDEFVAPGPDTLGVRVVVDPQPQHVAGRALRIVADVVADAPPDSVTLWIRPATPGGFRAIRMERTGSYAYTATVPPDRLAEGVHEYLISVTAGDSATAFPGGIGGSPARWDFASGDAWRIVVAGPSTPATLFDAAHDVRSLSFSRIGDGWREGIFRVVPSGLSAAPALHLELPVDVGGISPEDYTTSLFVGDRIAARAGHLSGATGLGLAMRGIGPAQEVHVTLVERDGTSWSATVAADSTWSLRTVPLSAFRPARGVKLPQGFPGTWNYWIEPAAGRGGAGDALRLGEVERLQLSLRRTPGAYGVEVERITLRFDGAVR